MYELIKKYGPLSLPGSCFNAIIGTSLAIGVWIDGVDGELIPGLGRAVVTGIALTSVGVFVWRVIARLRAGAHEAGTLALVQMGPAEEGDEERSLHTSSPPWDGGESRCGIIRSGPWRGREATVGQDGELWALEVAADPADEDDPDGSEYVLDERSMRDIAERWRIRWL